MTGSEVPLEVQHKHDWFISVGVPSTRGGKNSKKFYLLENLLISFWLLKGLLTMWDLRVGAWVERRQNIINTTETYWHLTRVH